MGARFASKCRTARAALVLSALLVVRATAPAASVAIERVSLDESGGDPNGPSFAPSISGDGRFVAFTSSAPDLVAQDLNGVADVFVRDRLLGTTLRASIAVGGGSPDGASNAASLSDDGRYVAFESDATNLISSDTNGQRDVFVFDRVQGTTTRVSVDSSGVQANAGSSDPAISGDGRFVAFLSDATNLIALDSNGQRDVFVHDLELHTTERVSVGPSGAQANSSSSSPSISGDGDLVVFQSAATNLVVGGDQNGFQDVFVHDRLLLTTNLVSLSTSGSQGNSNSSVPVISRDGSHVVFVSTASNLVPNDANGLQDIFVRDVGGLSTTIVSVDSNGLQANQLSERPSISGDGRFVVFDSRATNLVPSDGNGRSDVFVHDRDSGETIRASVGPAGVEADSDSRAGVLDTDGALVAFESGATNLVAGDGNGAVDVYVNGAGAPAVPGLQTSGRGLLLACLVVLASAAAAVRPRSPLASVRGIAPPSSAAR